MTQSLTTLKTLIKVLEEENQALLDNCHESVVQLARKKTELIAQLGKGSELLDDPETAPLLQQCEALNRSNGAAISAALNHTRQLLEHVAPANDTAASGYSANGLRDSVALSGRSFGRI